ncbi:MAG: ribonuclease P protein component [Bdellovibrionales bacterium]|nr:ribonuclease P protein component [Bdellovibrionales bacterium]NQZ17671.1 ribonuclease P protein component [Bdellovibrionales bacterium]
MSSLKLQAEFKSLREHGQFLHVNHWLAISFKKNHQGKLRWGWTIPKKVGNAIVRNRLRRWGREFVRGLDNDVDINFIFKAKGKEFYKVLSHDDFEKAFSKVFDKLNEH